jgi:hypothetical protein
MRTEEVYRSFAIRKESEDEIKISMRWSISNLCVPCVCEYQRIWEGKFPKSGKRVRSPLPGEFRDGKLAVTEKAANYSLK